MPFSERSAQKSVKISDGKDTFKGGLSIDLTYKSLTTRVRGFYIFSEAALSAIFCGKVELSFFNLPDEEWKKSMDK